jgi:prolipoprotein diacylglyceryltransferase
MDLLQPHPIFFTFSGFEVTSHGIFFALGALLATFFLTKKRSIFDLAMSEMVERVLVIFVIGLLGARIGYLTAYPNQWQSAGDIIAIWQGGLVSFTGIVAGLGVVALYAQRFPLSVRVQWYAVIVQATLLGWALGRVGNYYAAESGGTPSALWQVTYGHVPIQLFEAAGCVFLFLIIRRYQQPLLRVYLGIGGYLVLRFLVDFWRDETRWGLHVSQWVALLGLCLLGVWVTTHREKPS